MFDTLLIITLFLLASFLVRLLTLRLSISVKHLCLFFHSLPILTDFFEIPTPPPPFIKYNKNLRPPPFILIPLFIRHLRVGKLLLHCGLYDIFEVLRSDVKIFLSQNFLPSKYFQKKQSEVFCSVLGPNTGVFL